MDGYTPNISTARKISNLAVQVGIGALLAAVDMSDGDAYEAERIMTGMALDKIATDGQDEGEKLARFFDKGAAVSRQVQIDRQQYALRQQLTYASKTQAADIRQELAALDAEYQDLRDPRTPAQIEADQHDAETRETHESARP